MKEPDEPPSVDLHGLTVEQALRRLAQAHPAASWVVPLGLASYIRGWGARAITELDWWQTADVGGIRITGTPARHFSARRLGDRNRTLWCGFALEAAVPAAV